MEKKKIYWKKLLFYVKTILISTCIAILFFKNSYAIYIGNFDPPQSTFEENNPVLAGALYSQQLQNQYLQNQILANEIKLQNNKMAKENEIAQKQLALERGLIKTMLFGKTNTGFVYLGCLSCNSNAKDSIFNPKSIYSKHNGNTVYNPQGKYGSKISDYSVCNPNALNPPVVVDSQGAFWGTLTMNKNLSSSLDNPEVSAWLFKVCN